jgi:hypothetical protein
VCGWVLSANIVMFPSLIIRLRINCFVTIAEPIIHLWSGVLPAAATISSKGILVQKKLKETIQAAFPDAKVARMDIDTVKGKNAMTF